MPYKLILDVDTGSDGASAIMSEAIPSDNELLGIPTEIDD